jgi:hypothetical protein
LQQKFIKSTQQVVIIVQKNLASKVPAPILARLFEIIAVIAASNDAARVQVGGEGK